MAKMTEEFEHFNFQNDENHAFKKYDNVILEAKRVISNGQFENIAGYKLSCLPEEQSNLFAKECKKHLGLRNERFWDEKIPPPGIDIQKHDCSNTADTWKEVQAVVKENLQIIPHERITTESNRDLPPDKTHVMRKYFKLWHIAICNRKSRKQSLEEKINQKEKLDALIKNMKRQRKQRLVQSEDTQNEQTKINLGHEITRNYTNRFKAQKAIINMQKSKLEEQNKLIEELKLGIIREDLIKSIENTKVNIRELFATCSQKVKMTAPMVLIEGPRLAVNPVKVPKVVQQMEDRALQRAQNRLLILERKRLIDEARQRMLEEAIEKKKILEEEDRKRNLEAIKEKRKREMELERIRQINKQRYFDNLNRAIRFHRKLVLKQSFHKLYKNALYFREKDVVARDHLKKKVLVTSLNCWIQYIELLYKPKYDIADAHLAYKVLNRCFSIWKSAHTENHRNRQVAEDYYDFQLTSNTFIHWHRYVCKETMLQMKNVRLAEMHYNRKIVFQYFYQWRALKSVLELEKAKELKKRRWREKVWEILPDYRPPENCFN